MGKKQKRLSLYGEETEEVVAIRGRNRRGCHYMGKKQKRLSLYGEETEEVVTIYGEETEEVVAIRLINASL